MTGEKTLDIGIGAGGAYITQDKKNGVLRIGLDIANYDLIDTKNTYGVPVVNADAETNNNVHLPFKGKSFSHVEIFFPHDELLTALTDPESKLLPEIKRITKRDILIILDASYFGMQGVYSHGEPITLNGPDELVAGNLESHGFKIQKYDRMTIEEVQQLGTQFSQSASRWMKDMLPQKVYRIVAAIK